jgi:hypothetical protein
MPQIVQPRLITSTIGATNTGKIAKARKSSFYDAPRDRRPRAKNKEGCFILLGMAILLPFPGVFPHSPVEFRSKGYQARFVEFRVTDRQAGLPQIYIHQFQPEGLATAQAGTIEEQQNVPEGMRLEFHVISVERSGAIEEAPKFSAGIQVRRERFWALR